MLIVFGFTVRFSTTASVVFFCPTCGGDRAGLRRSARRWFTVFWIPVVPLRRMGEVVECHACHTRHHPDVADQPTTAELAEHLTTAVRVLTAMIVRTGPAPHPALRDAAVTHVARSVPGYSPATLDSDAAGIDPALAEQYTVPLAHGLEVGGKERLLADLVQICLAADTITADQRRVIDRAGRGLGLTPVHVTGVVTSEVSGRARPSAEPPDAVDPGHPDPGAPDLFP